MEVSVRGQHFDVPDGVEERARRKLGRLDRYLPLLREAIVEVDVAQERTKEPDRRYIVRVSVKGGGAHLRAEERAAKPEAAVDQAARALTDQARKHKERLYRRNRQKSPEKAPPPPRKARPAKKAPVLPGGVARIKRFAMKPMTLDEAVEQMEMLRHSFFLFHDADEGQIAIVYRRRAGDYGLIVPELP